MNRIQIRVLGALGLVVLAGCSGRGELRCESTARYLASGSISPLRIPDTLSVPDESQALRIPPGTGSPLEPRQPGNCLEAPPDFLGGVTPAQPGP